MTRNQRWMITGFWDAMITPRVLSLEVPRGSVWGLHPGLAPPRQTRASFLPAGSGTDTEGGKVATKLQLTACGWCP